MADPVFYDHDGFLAATRLITAHQLHGRESDEFQGQLRVVLAEYALDGVIAALTEIANGYASGLPKPLAVLELLNQVNDEFYDRYLQGEFRD